MSDDELLDGIPLVHDVDAKCLNRLQIEDYRGHRRDVLTWLWQEGRAPNEGEGYSVRYSTGTYMAREEGLVAAQDQLRHRSDGRRCGTTGPLRRRRDGLDRM